LVAAFENRKIEGLRQCVLDARMEMTANSEFARNKKQIEKDLSENPRRHCRSLRLYSEIDILEDVKCACAPGGVRFDDDIFNELVG
jgi:hypothetical protein